MLLEQDYHFLVRILFDRDRVFPRRLPYEFDDGFVPQHLQCHLTASHLSTTKGWPIISGICWLDLDGKLYPWPHMFNQRGQELVDFSPRVDQPIMGVTVITNSEVKEHFQRISDAFDVASVDPNNRSRWLGYFENLLSESWYQKLRDERPKSRAQIPPGVKS